MAESDGKTFKGITLRLPVDVYEAICRAAEEDVRDKSKEVLFFVQKALRRREEGFCAAAEDCMDAKDTEGLEGKPASA